MHAFTTFVRKDVRRSSGFKRGTSVAKSNTVVLTNISRTFPSYAPRSPRSLSPISRPPVHRSESVAAHCHIRSAVYAKFISTSSIYQHPFADYTAYSKS
jgi:hypothetical protein